jgi:hypothetical protein
MGGENPFMMICCPAFLIRIRESLHLSIKTLLTRLVISRTKKTADLRETEKPPEDREKRKRSTSRLWSSKYASLQKKYLPLKINSGSKLTAKYRSKCLNSSKRGRSSYSMDLHPPLITRI